MSSGCADYYYCCTPHIIRIVCVSKLEVKKMAACAMYMMIYPSLMAGGLRASEEHITVLSYLHTPDNYIPPAPLVPTTLLVAERAWTNKQHQI